MALLKNMDTGASAFAAALFWGFVAISFSSLTEPSSTNALFPSALSLAVGNVGALIAAGFLGPKATERHLFRLGLVCAIASTATYAADAIWNSALISSLHLMLSCGTSAILVLAWCERTSCIVPSKRPFYLATSSFASIAIVLITFQIPPEHVNSFASALLPASCVGALLTLDKDDESAAGLNGERLSRSLIALMFVFGFAIGIIAVISNRLDFHPSTPFSNDFDPILMFWIGLSVAAIIVAWILLSKRPLPLLSAIMIPLVSLGLLLPPFIHKNFHETLPAITAFLVVCEGIVFSIGPSNVKQTIKIGASQFTFWKRAWGIVGLLVGYICAAPLLDVLPIQEDSGFVHAVAIAYAILSLTVAALVGRVSLKDTSNSPGSRSISEISASVTDRYQLTPREIEVFELLAQGRSAPYIQEKLCISRGTATTHINHIYQKMNIHSRQELLDLVQTGETEKRKNRCV